MEVPAEAHLCPDCAGMGKRLYDPTTRGYVPNSVRSGSVRYTMRPCMRCHSLGYLKTPPVR